MSENKEQSATQINVVADAQSNYPLAQSALCFKWLCSKCTAVNYITWNSFDAYGRTDECSKCEKAHRIKVPFK